MNWKQAFEEASNTCGEQYKNKGLIEFCTGIIPNNEVSAWFARSDEKHCQIMLLQGDCILHLTSNDLEDPFDFSYQVLTVQSLRGFNLRQKARDGNDRTKGCFMKLEFHLPRQSSVICFNVYEQQDFSRFKNFVEKLQDALQS